MAENMLHNGLITVNNKVCSKCKIQKPISDFYKRYNEPRASCKKCDNEKALVNTRAYRNRKSNNVRFRLMATLNHIKAKALSKNLDFNITLDFMCALFDKQNGLCALSGMELSVGDTDDRLPSKNAMSIDRKDSKIGYIIGNVRLVTNQVNLARNRFDDLDFLNMCFAVVRKFESSASGSWGKISEITSTKSNKAMAVEI